MGASTLVLSNKLQGHPFGPQGALRIRFECFGAPKPAINHQNASVDSSERSMWHVMIMVVVGVAPKATKLRNG